MYRCKAVVTRAANDPLQSRRRPLLGGAFNQEKALVGAFYVIVKTDGWFTALVVTDTILLVLGRYLMVINSSINIIIYCWGGKQFKAVLLSLICCRRIEDQVGDQTAPNQHSKLDTNSNFAVSKLHQLAAAKKGRKCHFMCHTEYTS